MKRRKWEYAVEVSSSNSTVDLQGMGEEGWELVAVVKDRWENERKGYQEESTTYYYKRPAE